MKKEYLSNKTSKVPNNFITSLLLFVIQENPTKIKAECKHLFYYVFKCKNFKRHKPSLNIITTKTELNEGVNKNRTNQTLTPTIIKELSVRYISLF